MSSGKRSATSELNHDNWDDEVESEEAGTFAQADQNTLKERVIKKAKRRGLTNPDGAPSVFSGFGGFKSAPSGGNSFSFLSKPTNGSENGVPKSTAGQGFVFGNPNNGSSATTVPSSFSFGAKPATSTNGTDNKQEVDSKIETTGTNGANGQTSTNIFQFGSESKTTTSSIFGGSTTQSFASKSVPKENTFGTEDSSSKKENVNELKSDAFKSEPSVASSNLPPLNQLAAFKPSGGNKWTCSICMVANDAEKDKCVCCEATKPGLEVKKDTSTTSNPLGSIAPGGGFKFGVTSTSGSAASNTTSGFNFGSTASSSNSSQGFKFGSDSITTAAKGFSSSITSSLDSKESKSSEESKSTVNSDTNTTKSSSDSFERVSDEEVKRIANNSKEFLSHLSALNQQFFEWIDQHIKKSPYILISPCIRDYEKHLAELAKEYADKKDKDEPEIKSSVNNEEKKETTITSVEKPPPAKGLLSGVFGNAASTAAPTSSFSFGGTQPFTFGQEKKSDSTSEKLSTAATTSGFSFGSSGAATSGFSFGGTSGTGSSFGSSSMFGQAAAAAIQAKKDEEGANADDDEEEPPKEEIKQVVEDDAIHSVRCKLFYMKNKEFKEKGLGMLYLKKVADNENKTQLVLRAETNLGNILLNIMLTKQMNLEKRKNCIQFVCIPNPEIPGIEAGSPTTMLVKVKNVDQASILEDEIKKRIDII